MKICILYLYLIKIKNKLRFIWYIFVKYLFLIKEPLSWNVKIFLFVYNIVDFKMYFICQ